MSTPIRRRTVTRGLVWAVPTTAVVAAAPLASASPMAGRGCDHDGALQTWGYDIASREYLCRGFSGEGHPEEADVDALVFEFTITAEDGLGYGPLPAGSRFVFALSSTARAFQGTDAVVEVGRSADTAAVGTTGWSEGKLTLAVDVLRDVTPTESITVWVRVIADPRLALKVETFGITGQLENPTAPFMVDVDTACRARIEEAFNGDRDITRRSMDDRPYHQSAASSMCNQLAAIPWAAATQVTG